MNSKDAYIENLQNYLSAWNFKLHKWEKLYKFGYLRNSYAKYTEGFFKSKFIFTFHFAKIIQ